MSEQVVKSITQVCPVLSPLADRIKPGIYRHYKGNLYRVVGVGLHEQTHEELVIYQALYGNYEWWLRSVTIFQEEIEYEGKKQQRFSFIGNVKSNDCCS